MNDYDVKVVLPKSYDLVAGDTFQLFYRGVIEAANPFCYDILAVCEKGINYPRYFEFTPEKAGSHRLTITVFANDKTVLAKGETVLNVYEAKKLPEREVNILCVGDSLTASGIWVEEAHRRLTDVGGAPQGLGLSGFNFIGTCRRGKAGYEGYGGWQWENYLSAKESGLWVSCAHNKTEIDQHSLWEDENGNSWQLETIEPSRIKFNRMSEVEITKPAENTVLRHIKNAENTEDILAEASYFETPNPFKNDETGEVDFKNYCEKNGFGKIDAAYFFLTWNGQFNNTLPLKEYCRKLSENGKMLIDILHKQYPEAKVKIMGLQIPSVNGGTGASYGAVPPYCDDYGLTRFVLELNRAYEAWCLEEKYKEFTEFINISGQFDSDYNMPNTEKCVNTRSMRTETVGTNGVHPLPEGYLQIADAVYRNMVKSFVN